MAEYTWQAVYRDHVVNQYPLDTAFHKKGDVNWDGKIGVDDLNRIKAAFGSTPNDPNWDPDCDLNGDGTVDLFDVAMVTNNVGKVKPRGEGTQNSYHQLNRNGLVAFNLVDPKGAIVVHVPLPVGAKLFYRMRMRRERAYILGWQSPTDKHIWLVHSDGKVETFRNFVENSLWLDPPNFRDYEKVEEYKPRTAPAGSTMRPKRM